MVLKWVVISPYVEHARKLVTGWLSMRKNWLLIGWEHAWKLVIRWLSLREYNFSAPRTFSEFFLCSPSHPFFCLLLLSLSNVLCPMSHVSALLPVLRPLSYVSVPCLPSSILCLTWSVPCLTSSFLRPLTPITWSTVPFSVALFLCSSSLFLCFPSPDPSSLVLFPWPFILGRMRVFLSKIQ